MYKCTNKQLNLLPYPTIHNMVIVIKIFINYENKIVKKRISTATNNKSNVMYFDSLILDHTLLCSSVAMVPSVTCSLGT